MTTSFPTPAPHAAAAPDRVACLLEPGGAHLTYAELDGRSRRLAAVLRAGGLGPDDVLACYLENRLDYLVATWAARRSGLRYSNINTHLKPAEVEHVLVESGAKALLTSARFAPAAGGLGRAVDDLLVKLSADEGTEGFDHVGRALDGVEPMAPSEESEGQEMLFTGGTTGRPKGVITEYSSGYIGATQALLGLAADDVVLLPTPLYHGLANRMAVTATAVGCSALLMDHWDPLAFLELIERHRVTSVAVVPSIFVRLLKLTEEERSRFDMSSLRVALVSGAPCPVVVKERIIDWWGPIVTEGYGATEGHGMAGCTAADWLAHKGTIGKATVGIPHIVDDDGLELPPGEIGTLWFEDGPDFSYHNDSERTAATRNEQGWRTVGDVGHIDAEGYLYLADRKDFMILVNGVNVYPQQTEDVLLLHPKVRDAAVFGVPDEVTGEQVKAVVQLLDPASASPEVAEELIESCRQHLAHIKCPRSVDFTDDLPRDDTGKLRKGLLRDAYRHR